MHAQPDCIFADCLAFLNVALLPKYIIRKLESKQVKTGTPALIAVAAEGVSA